ncbi:MAG: hypothetical protein IAF38_21435 [Bacteroidia bacterium]|nr:hypothetical protein [Bacteroidia bacterium]
MRRKKIFLFVFFLSGIFLFSQKLIFEEFPQKILEPPVYGIKGKHFVYFFNEGSFLLGPGGADSIKTHAFLSSSYALGLRYNLKLSKKINWVNDFAYRIKSFNIKQNNNRFPDTLTYKKEKLNFNQLCLSSAIRFIYGKKRRYFGKYIDIGATAAWNFNTTRYLKQELENTDPTFKKQIAKIHQRDLSYVNSFEADAFIAFGFEKVQLKLQYRLTDCFTKYNGIKLPELPRLMVGLNFKFVSVEKPDGW